jgi:protein SPIRAL1 and related proteins
MSRGGSSGGGRSSLSYLFEPEETVLYRTRTSNQETEKAPDTNSGCVKQDDDEKKAVGTEAVHSPPKREVSNPILSSHKPPCNIYHTGQLSSGLLITVSAAACVGMIDYIYMFASSLLLRACVFRTGLRRGCAVHQEGRRRSGFCSVRSMRNNRRSQSKI